MAPRVIVRCSGELASGSSVADIVVGDMSMTGCSVEIDDVADDMLGKSGVLSIPSPDGTDPAMLLPVVVCNNRVQGGKPRLGLKFRALSMVQVRRLIAVMHQDGRDA